MKAVIFPGGGVGFGLAEIWTCFTAHKKWKKKKKDAVFLIEHTMFRRRDFDLQGWPLSHHHRHHLWPPQVKSETHDSPRLSVNENDVDNCTFFNLSVFLSDTWRRDVDDCKPGASLSLMTEPDVCIFPPSEQLESAHTACVLDSHNCWVCRRYDCYWL